MRLTCSPGAAEIRIAHVVATFPPYWAGTSSVAFHYSVELGRRGHDVTVFTSEFPLGDYRDPPEIRVVRLPTPARLGNAPFTPSLLAALHRFDIVHLHWPFIFGAELTWLACRLSGRPYVLSYLMDLRSDLRWQFGPYQAVVGPLVIGGAARVMPISLDHFGASPMRRHAASVTEIPPGVDLARFHPEVDGSRVRERLGIGSRDVVVGYLGAMDRAHPFKGVPVLLEALASLAPSLPALRLLAVGGGDLQPTYRADAERLGLADRAHWTGVVPGEELPEHLAAMDLLVLPSLGFGAESFGIVLLEAMASGKPVVATALPGVRAVVDDGRDGYLVEPGRADALADAIRRLVADADLRAAFGAAGCRKVGERYDWRRIADRLEAEYRAILAGPGGRG